MTLLNFSLFWSSHLSDSRMSHVGINPGAVAQVAKRLSGMLIFAREVNTPHWRWAIFEPDFEHLGGSLMSRRLIYIDRFYSLVSEYIGVLDIDASTFQWKMRPKPSCVQIDKTKHMPIVAHMDTSLFCHFLVVLIIFLSIKKVYRVLDITIIRFSMFPLAQSRNNAKNPIGCAMVLAFGHYWDLFIFRCLF